MVCSSVDVITINSVGFNSVVPLTASLSGKSCIVVDNYCGD